MKLGILFSIIFFFNISAHQGIHTTTSGVNTLTMTAKFKVYGNCEMCKKRIEKAAKIEGVNTAIWDVDTKILIITFDEQKVKPSKVHQAVAAVGHDTDLVKAENAVYRKLHSCCQYERAQ